MQGRWAFAVFYGADDDALGGGVCFWPEGDDLGCAKAFPKGADDLVGAVGAVDHGKRCAGFQCVEGGFDPVFQRGVVYMAIGDRARLVGGGRVRAFV